MLDNPWKIAALVGVLVLLRVLVGAWRNAPERAFLVELFNSALIAFALVFLLIRPVLLQAFFIPSGSMEPTLHQPEDDHAGDRILVNKFIYHLNLPRRGDIVVFRAPPEAGYDDRTSLQNGGSKDYIKRVIGLPGDRIQIRAGDGVYVNGQRLNEPYIAQIPDYDWPLLSSSPAPPGLPLYFWPREGLGKPYTVPAGHLFVLGDNRNYSNDSHLWRDPRTGEGKPALPLQNVLGRSLIIFWPPNRFTRLTH